MFSNNVLKRFIKDYKLPIQVIQEPYFSYFMNLYKVQYDTKNKFNLLEEAIKNFNNEDEFLNEYYKIRDNIIKDIESTDEYQNFNTLKMDDYNVPNNGYPSHDIFNLENINKYYVSIDLKKANFQALKSVGVLKFDTYEQLINNFSDLDYMKDSKYLRQVIFGNMNPKRQVKVERWLTEQILNYLLEKGIFLKEKIKMVSNDEIVFAIDKQEIVRLDDMDMDLEIIIKNNLGINVDIEIFYLNNIESTKFFVKEYINKDGYELMCVPLVYHAQVYKKYNNLQIEDKDLVFFYENQICKFINPLDFNKGGK